MKPLTFIKSLLSRVFTSVLTKVVPDHTKRLVMLSSLYARMCNKTSFDSNTISKLNKIMALGKRDNALQFPIQLSSVIWNADQGKTVLYPAPAIQVSEAVQVDQILEKVPSWLLYSDKENVSQDIALLLANRSKLEA